MIKKDRAVFYARVSTEEEAQLKALPKQIEENREEINKRGWILVDEYIDEGKSGTKVKGRDEYQRLLDDMELDKFDIVVVKDQERLQRNTKDWYIFVDKLVVNHLELFFYLENKFYTPDDALITGIKAIMAEEYSRNLSKKLHNYNDRRVQKAKEGQMVKLQGSGNAFGWDKKDGVYVINPEQFQIRRRMCELILQGKGSTEVAKILNNEGYRNSVGKEWKATDIPKYVYDERNIGVAIINKERNDFATKSVIKNPPEEWVRVEGAYPPVVTMEEWERLCEIRKARTTNGNKGLKVGKSIFSGKCFCGECGAKMWRTQQSGNKQEYWVCSTKRQYGSKVRKKTTASGKVGEVNLNGCDNKAISRKHLNEIMEAVAERLEANPEVIKADMIKWLTGLKNSILEANSHYTEADLKKEQSRKDKLLDSLLDGVISKEDYSRKAESIEEKIAQIKSDLKAEGSKLEDIAEIDKVLDNIDEEIAKYLDDSNKLKVDFVLEHFERVEVYPDKAIVKLPIFNREVIVEKVQYVSGEKWHKIHTATLIPLGDVTRYNRKINLFVELVA